MTTASAPGKIILFGEHAVVYSRPALAIPVVTQRVRVEVADSDQPTRVVAAAVNLDARVGDLASDHPLRAALDQIFAKLEPADRPNLTLTIRSDLPVAGGMGSGAAVTVALSRALQSHLGLPADNDTINELAYAIEKIHHGTPSGIDNSVITYERPIYFVRGQGPLPCRVQKPIDFLIADTGIPSPTAVTVQEVRAAWQADSLAYEQCFDEIGQLAQMARFVLETGRIAQLGPLMNMNQKLLRKIKVSSTAIENLVKAALAAGAAGAKLSGGGRGGNVVVQCESDVLDTIRVALLSAGASRVFHTRLEPSK